MAALLALLTGVPPAGPAPVAEAGCRLAAGDGGGGMEACRATAVAARDGSDDRTFFGRDDRRPVPAAEYPWSAIGKLYFESGGHCTGTLVAAQVVLTAAHCLYDGDGGSGLDRPTEFYAGLDGRRHVAHARAVSFYHSPRFDNREHSETSRIDGLDWAFVRLDRDIGRIAGTLPVRDVTGGDLRRAVDQGWRVIQAGYPADNKSRMMAHIGCRIVEVFNDNTVFHQCDTLHGDSGSPLFIEIGGRFEIIAVESAVYPDPEGRYDNNMAVDARAFHHELIRYLDRVEK